MNYILIDLSIFSLFSRLWLHPLKSIWKFIPCDSCSLNYLINRSKRCYLLYPVVGLRNHGKAVSCNYTFVSDRGFA
jgi:hypothetical protein